MSLARSLCPDKLLQPPWETDRCGTDFSSSPKPQVYIPRLDVLALNPGSEKLPSCRCQVKPMLAGSACFCWLGLLGGRLPVTEGLLILWQTQISHRAQTHLMHLKQAECQVRLLWRK